jgi:diketogulonate reductase-like aldo/keto reductase
VGTYTTTVRKDVRNAVKAAWQAGYRHFDTATFYENEAALGSVFAELKLPRDDFFCTSKVWPSDMGKSSTTRAFNQSLSDLKLDYVDLYLMHWPGESVSLRHETWEYVQHLISWLTRDN